MASPHHRSASAAEQRERDLARIREQIQRLEREESEAEDAARVARLADFSKPALPADPWERLLPRDRDTTIDTLHTSAGRIREAHYEHRGSMTHQCTCLAEVEALRVAAAVLSALRDA